jgi:hypothetical protein
MKHKVLIAFNEPEHGVVYHAGETYPARGKTATPERIQYLSGSKNKFGKPCLAPVGAKAAKAEKE